MLFPRRRYWREGVKQICVLDNGNIISADDYGNLVIGITPAWEYFHTLDVNKTLKIDNGRVTNIQEIDSDLCLLTVQQDRQDNSTRLAVILQIPDGELLAHWRISSFTFAHPAILPKIDFQVCYLHPDGNIRLKTFRKLVSSEFTATGRPKTTQRSIFQQRRIRPQSPLVDREVSLEEVDERQFLWSRTDNLMSLVFDAAKNVILALSESKCEGTSSSLDSVSV